MMTSVAYVEEQLRHVLETRANELARETGCIVRQRKLDGATLLQTLLFGFQQHGHASLEQLASTAQIHGVGVTDTAIDKRFSEACARFLHAVLQEMSTVVVQAAQAVPLKLLKRFSAVICEDSSTIKLPDELADLWPGCGGRQGPSAAVKVHTRWDLTRGRLWGPKLTAGRTSDRRSPFREEALPGGSLYIGDLGYFSVSRFVERRKAGGYTLSRLQAGTALFTPQGEAIVLAWVLPKQVGQFKELTVLVGARKRHPMRLLLLRVPQAVGDQRRKDLLADAKRRGQTVSQETLWLADWTILVTDVPAERLRLEEALVLLRERWQMELLYKLWKQQAQVDEWHTQDRWRKLCELYAKLLAVTLQHWLIVLFAWHDPQRSLVKLAQVVQDTGWTLMEALAGLRSVHSALRLIQRRMQSGCQMNKRHKHPNSAQLLEAQAVEWALSWCE
jgi:Transposase DDE domain